MHFILWVMVFVSSNKKIIHETTNVDIVPQQHYTDYIIKYKAGYVKV